ncbi:MAG: hypothetical protein K6G00_11165 [Treponema sp.]|nr:hypothetical protein [Treponema sp.]
MQKKEINGFMAAHSIPNMFYILRKDFKDSERREILLTLTELIPIVSIDHAKIVSALKAQDFSDFEDCLQSECAEEIGGFLHNHTECKRLRTIKNKSNKCR